MCVYPEKNILCISVCVNMSMCVLRRTESLVISLSEAVLEDVGVSRGGLSEVGDPEGRRRGPGNHFKLMDRHTKHTKHTNTRKHTPQATHINYEKMQGKCLTSMEIRRSQNH